MVCYFFMFLAEFVSVLSWKLAPMSYLKWMNSFAEVIAGREMMSCYFIKVFQVHTWNIFSLHCLYNFISFWEICSVLSNEKKKAVSCSWASNCSFRNVVEFSYMAWDVESFYFKDAVLWLDRLFFLPRFYLPYVTWCPFASLVG